jgi:DNA polymerase kappa
MDAFYVMCELVRRPELRGLPVAVGGTAMLATSSYEARRFGVRSAMPGYMARRLCPELTILPPDFALYTRVAAAVREVFARFDPHFSSGSLDEASLDVTAYLAAHPAEDGEGVARRIKAEIFDRTQCTASIGIAANRSLAKICSVRQACFLSSFSCESS